MFCNKIKIASAARKPWGSVNRRLALSSSVRFHPLHRSRRRGVRLQAHQETVPGPQNPLAPHRIAFVGHRRAADLIGLERLFHLFCAKRATADRCPSCGADWARPDKHIDNLRIDFAGVGLPRSRHNCRQNPSLLATSRSSSRNLRMIARENRARKNWLACRWSLLILRASSETDAVLDLCQIERQVIGPQASSLYRQSSAEPAASV